MGPRRKDPIKHIVCPCLRVTEAEVRAAVRKYSLTTLKGINRCTEAGDGCTACHADLRRILREEPSSKKSRSARKGSSPILSHG